MPPAVAFCSLRAVNQPEPVCVVIQDARDALDLELDRARDCSCSLVPVSGRPLPPLRALLYTQPLLNLILRTGCPPPCPLPHTVHAPLSDPDRDARADIVSAAAASLASSVLSFLPPRSLVPLPASSLVWCDPGGHGNWPRKQCIAAPSHVMEIMGCVCHARFVRLAPSIRPSTGYTNAGSHKWHGSGHADCSAYSALDHRTTVRTEPGPSCCMVPRPL